jgi:hypothetical protein
LENSLSQNFSSKKLRLKVFRRKFCQKYFLQEYTCSENLLTEERSAKKHTTYNFSFENYCENILLDIFLFVNLEWNIFLNFLSEHSSQGIFCARNSSLKIFPFLSVNRNIIPLGNSHLYENFFEGESFAYKYPPEHSSSNKFLRWRILRSEYYSLEKFTPTSFSVGNLHRKLFHFRKFFAQKVLHQSILRC